MQNIFANLISLPISIISSFLIARILGPELTGITAATIMLVLHYTINAHLGTLNALGQRYPYLMGQMSTESREEAKQMLGIVLGFISVGAAGVAIVVLGLAFWQFLIGSRLIALGFSFGAVIAVLQLYKTYYIFVIRSTNQFKYWSQYTLIFSWVPLTWFIGARWGGIVAQWIALTITELIMCLSLYRNVGRKIKLELDLKASWKYIKLGFPIYVVGTLFGVFTTIDRLTAAIFLGTTALGFYGVATMAATFLGIMPGMISQIMWPRMAEKLGVMGKEWREMLPFIEKPTLLMAFILPILIGVTILVIPPVIEIFLPRYVPGIAAAQISILTVYFLGFMGMYTVFLCTSLRLIPYGIITVLGILLNLIGAYLSVHFGWGLVGLAWAKVIAYGMVAILLFCYVEKLFNRKWQELFLRMTILLAPMIVVYLLTFWIIPWLVPSSALSNSEMLHKTSYQVIILIIFTSPLVLFALRICRVMEDVIVSIRRVFPQFSRIRQL
jgi:O-antigen/teichoic acid export membrane protein